MSESKRNIVTTYFGPTIGEGDNAYKPVVKITRGSNPMELVGNVARNMAQQRWGEPVVVAEAHDEEYGELLLVATMFIGEHFQIMFEADRSRPIIVTDFDEDLMREVRKARRGEREQGDHHGE